MTLVPLVVAYAVPLALLGVTLLVIGWLRYVKSHYDVFTWLGLPGPKPTFLFGNALEFGKALPLDLYTQWSKYYGNIFGYYEGLQPSIVVTCPKIAHEILVKQFFNFSARPIHSPFLYDPEQKSLQHSNGLVWKRQRQVVSAGMSGRCIREMFPSVQKITERLVVEIERAMLKSSDGFVINGLMESYSVHIIAQAALGYQTDAFSDRDDLFLRYMRAAHQSASTENTATGLARLFPSLTSILRPLDWKHKLMAERMRESVQEFVDVFQKDPSNACPIMRSFRAHSAPEQSKIHNTSLNGDRDVCFNKSADSVATLEAKGGGTGNNKNSVANSSVNSITKQFDVWKGQNKTRSEERLSSNRIDSSGTKQATKTIPKSRHEKAGSGVNKNEQTEKASQTNQNKATNTEATTNGPPRDALYNQEDVDDQEYKPDNEEMVGQVMGLLAAGLGPLSAVMTFVLYCLAVHREEQEKVVAEIEEVTAGKDQINLQELKSLKTVEWFIYEALRMFPVAPGVSRECVEDCVIHGNKFTRGMVVRIMSGVMYRSEENFQHPQQFMPERFKGREVNHAWMPFGQGPRKCVADRLGLLVCKLCTVMILQRFQVCANDDTQVPLQLALRPFLVPRDGVSLKFVER